MVYPVIPSVPEWSLGVTDPTTPSQVEKVNSSGAAIVSQSTPYPNGATPLNATSGDVSASTAAAVLAAASGKTTYITGFTFTSTGSTVTSTVDITVTDGTWTIAFVYVSVAGAATANQPLNIDFPYPLPASAPNTTITASAPSLGSGNLHACMNCYGFQL